MGYSRLIVLFFWAIDVHLGVSSRRCVISVWSRSLCAVHRQLWESSRHSMEHLSRSLQSKPESNNRLREHLFRLVRATTFWQTITSLVSLVGRNSSSFTSTSRLFIKNPSAELWGCEVTYRFVSATSSSALNFVINRSPYSRSCSIHPLNSTTSTVFPLSYADWFDEDGIKNDIQTHNKKWLHHYSCLDSSFFQTIFSWSRQFFSELNKSCSLIGIAFQAFEKYCPQRRWTCGWL